MRLFSFPFASTTANYHSFNKNITAVHGNSAGLPQFSGRLWTSLE